MRLLIRKGFEMSLYQMTNGVNLATFIILPLLGKHPESYPRFRDCFITDSKPKGMMEQICENEPNDFSEYKDTIKIYTRIGGGNREEYEKEIEELRNMPGYIADEDDNFDSTYATFIFKIPEKYINDINLIKEGKIKETSKEYQEFIINFWKEKSNIPDFYKKIEGIFNNKEN